MDSIGLVSDQACIKSNNRNGVRIPTAMLGSAGKTLARMSEGSPGVHLFAMGLSNKTHTVIVVVDNRLGAPAYYWADQWRRPVWPLGSRTVKYWNENSVDGFRAYTTSTDFDGEVLAVTRYIWTTHVNVEKKRKDWNSTLCIWKLRAEPKDSSSLSDGQFKEAKTKQGLGSKTYNPPLQPPFCPDAPNCLEWVAHNPPTNVWLEAAASCKAAVAFYENKVLPAYNAAFETWRQATDSYNQAWERGNLTAVKSGRYFKLVEAYEESIDELMQLYPEDVRGCVSVDRIVNRH